MHHLALGLLACAFLISGAQYSGVGFGHLAMLGVLLYSLFFLRTSVFFILTVVSLAVLKLAYDYFFAGQLSPNINTYLLFAMNWSAFLLVIKYASRWPTSDLATILIWCGVLHGGFLIMQFVTFNFIGDLSLLNPLGRFSPNGPDPSTHLPVPYNPQYQIIKRPNGLGWEPSAGGLIQMLALALLLSRERLWSFRNLLLSAPILMGGLLTLSVTFWVGVIFLFALRAVSAEGWSFSKLRKRFLLVPLLLLGLVSSPVFDRFEELSREGSSGYARVIAPLILAKDAVISPMGIEALGFRSFNDRTVFSQMEGRVERAGIANSFLEFIIYFGATGVLILVTAMGLAISRWHRWTFRKRFAIGVCGYGLMFGGYVFNSVALMPLIIFWLASQSEMPPNKLGYTSNQ